MGVALSCIPCVPSADTSGNPDDFSNEAPHSGQDHDLAKKKSQSETQRSSSRSSGVLAAARRNAGDQIQSGTERSSSLAEESSTIAATGRKDPAALSGCQEKDARPRSPLIGVLKDKQLTTVTIVTSTIIGSIVGLVTMSGVMGSIAYLLLLVVQLGCAALSQKHRTVTTKDQADPLPVETAPLPPAPTRTIIPLASPDSCRPEPSPTSVLPAKVDSVPEPRTKHMYPTIMNEHDGYPQDLELLSGLGIRDKKIALLTIDVYSVGVYVNGAQFGASFGGKYGDLSLSALKQRGEELFQDLIESTESVGRTLRLVINFSGLTPKMLVKAFDERLEVPMKAKGASDVYEDLRKGLGSINLYPGRVILLRMKTDGYLVATSDNTVLANTQSHVLCQAVTDIYLGRESPCPALKEDTVRRMHQTLHSPLASAAAKAPSSGSASSAAKAGAPAAAKSTATTELTGTWEVVEAENVEEFLVSLGISFLVRKVALQLYTKDMKIIDQSGSDVTFTDFRNRRKGSPVLFGENKTVHRKDKQGKPLEDVASWEGRTLVIKTNGYDDPLTTKYWREGQDTMVSETTGKDVTMRRKWTLAHPST